MNSPLIPSILPIIPVRFRNRFLVPCMWQWLLVVGQWSAGYLPQRRRLICLLVISSGRSVNMSLIGSTRVRRVLGFVLPVVRTLLSARVLVLEHILVVMWCRVSTAFPRFTVLVTLLSSIWTQAFPEYPMARVHLPLVGSFLHWTLRTLTGWVPCLIAPFLWVSPQSGRLPTPIVEHTGGARTWGLRNRGRMVSSLRLFVAIGVALSIALAILLALACRFSSRIVWQVPARLSRRLIVPSVLL